MNCPIMNRLKQYWLWIRPVMNNFSIGSDTYRSFFKMQCRSRPELSFILTNKRELWRVYDILNLALISFMVSNILEFEHHQFLLKVFHLSNRLVGSSTQKYWIHSMEKLMELKWQLVVLNQVSRNIIILNKAKIVSHSISTCQL